MTTTDTTTAGASAHADGGLAPQLFRHWIHSREEDTGDIEVFRPDGFAFPPSFGRDGFEMRTDGTFVQEDVGPADGVVRVEGRWRVAGPGQVAASFPGTSHEPVSFQVVDVDETVLRIRRTAEPAGPTTGPYATHQPADQHQLDAYQALPATSTFRLVDFDDAQIITLRTFPPRYVLRVSGTLPYANLDVELVPRVYIRQPEYWEIEVVGALRSLAVPESSTYRVSLPLDGIIGTVGIEVVGASRRQRFDLRATPDPGGRCGGWEAWIDAQPPGPSTLHLTGSCEFPTAGFQVELRRHEPQGINPRDLLLDRIVTPPSGPSAQVVTTVEVHFSEPFAGQLDTVTILPDGGTIPVRVAV